MRVLISGASIAGPVLAYWLNRYGFTVTVVERSPVLRKTGGHAVDLFRPELALAYHHRDIPAQRRLLREAFTGMHPEVDRVLGELDGDGVFYFDSISQLGMDTWSRGRVTLVGDAGYCPGPVVGGSTSLAVLGAYTLAGELAEAGGDPARAFPAYERAMIEPVRRSRAFALGAARVMHPTSRLGVWALAQLGRLVTALPSSVSAPVARLNSKGVRMHDSFQVREYPAPVR